jgi:UDP-N-acetylmuramyl pentapeptide synthase
MKTKLTDVIANIIKSGKAVLFKVNRSIKLEEATKMACERWKIK